MAFILISSVSASELTSDDINQSTYDIDFSLNDNQINASNDYSLDDNSANLDNDLSELKINEINEIDLDENFKIENIPKNQLSQSKSIYVSAEGSDETGDGSKDKPCQSIGYAVSKSDDDTSIYLSSGKYNGENNQNIAIDKTLTIIGESNASTIIDGENIAQLILTGSNAKLTLKGLSLINAFKEGNQSENGGAIINEGGEVTLINVTIRDSYGNYNGGAIYNNLGRIKIINSSFYNNSAIQYGGGIYSLGVTNIENSYFEENFITAEKGVGGAIAAGGTITINNTDFYRNHAIYSAGALLSLGDALIDNCNFLNQYTNYTGGAISNHGNMFINNSYFYGGEARFYAGAILAPPSGHHVITEVHNTIFEANHVGNHGAVTNNFKDTELIMENCALINNYIIPNYYYGDIALDDNASVLYCWWGQNTISPYYYSPHSDIREPWKINASKWLVMTFTSSNGLIDPEVNNVLTVDLKHYYDNETNETHEYNADLNLPLNVKFFTDSKQTITTKVLKNGTVSINYIPKENVKVVYAQINNQTLEIPVISKKESKMTVNDLTKYYKNESKLEVLLTDENDNPIANKTVAIEVQSKIYNKTTNENGIAKLSINLVGGNYTAKINFTDNEYKNQFQTAKITVLKNSSSIVASNLVKYYKNSSQLSVKLLDKSNNNPIASKKIKLTIDGKTYTKATDEKGIAKFTINQKANTYTSKLSFDEDRTYKASSKTIKITVKLPKITFKTTTVLRNSNFVAVFKDASGKAIKNTQVKLTINGKTFTRTTNSYGEAKLKISLKVGTYSLKSQFKSTNTYGAITLTKKIKVTK